MPRTSSETSADANLVVGDVHGHFETLRHALAELEVGEGDRVFSLGDLIDRGPHSIEALDWIEGNTDRRFNLVVRGNHEQMMWKALEIDDYARWRKSSPYPWDLWSRNGGVWWRGPEATKQAEQRWTAALRRLPYCARIDTAHGPGGARPRFPGARELGRARGAHAERGMAGQPHP